MRRNRIIWAALWVASVVLISFYGGAVSYGIFTILTLTPVISLAYILLVLARFKIYQYFECPEIVSRHVIPFYFTLQNEDFFAFSGVRVNFYSDFSSIEGLSDDIEYELLPGTKIKKDTGLICRYRGEYEVGIRSVVLQDHLRLFKITYRNREPLRVTVLPDIIELNSLRSLDMDMISDREGGTDRQYPDVTVRDYIAGDDIRLMSWKQTARTGRLSVRNLIGEEKDGVGIVADNIRSAEDRNTYLPIENRILETVIALSLFLKNKNIPVSVYYRQGSLDEQAVDSADTFNALYRIMSELSFDPPSEKTVLYKELMEQGSVYSKRTLFIVTAAADETVLEFSKSLNDSNTDVIIYLVKNSAETETPVKVFAHTGIFTVPADGDLVDIL